MYTPCRCCNSVGVQHFRPIFVGYDIDNVASAVTFATLQTWSHRRSAYMSHDNQRNVAKAGGQNRISDKLGSHNLQDMIHITGYGTC